MKTVAIYNFKGGSFKSTATHTLATGLASRGKRVLVVDTDPQAHATLMHAVQPSGGLYDLLTRNAKWQDVLEIAPQNNYGGGSLVAIVPGNDESATVTLRMPSPQLLRRRLAQVEDHFDVCLIDTSPTPSLMSSVIYLASDSVLYTTKCEALHYDGLVRAMSARDDANELRQQGGIGPLQTLGVVPAIYRSNTKEHQDYRQLIEDRLSVGMFAPVPERIYWAEAAGMQQPVFAYAPDTAAARDAIRFINEFEAVLDAT